MKYYIYKTTNLINNKIYIGKHKSTDIKNDPYYGSGKLLQRAIKKYGIENFKREILFESEDLQYISSMEANIVNEEFIARLDTYNIKLGGDGGFDYINNNKLNIYENHHEIVTKQSVINFSKGRETFKNKLKDKDYYDEYRQKLSNGIKLYYENGGTNPFKGRKHTEDTKVKIGLNSSIHQKGKNNSQYGTMWIYNIELKQSKKIKKSDPIPDGWKVGRKIKF